MIRKISYLLSKYYFFVIILSMIHINLIIYKYFMVLNHTIIILFLIIKLGLYLRQSIQLLNFVKQVKYN